MGTKGVRVNVQDGVGVHSRCPIRNTGLAQVRIGVRSFEDYCLRMEVRLEKPLSRGRDLLNS
jgi:hypothetical protein